MSSPTGEKQPTPGDKPPRPSAVQVAPYLQAILDHLSAADPVMARLVEERGPLSITASPQDDYFFTVLDAIASQQLSSKVAATIVSRIRALVPGEDTPTAAQIFALPDQALRDVGLSWAKVSYIKDLARRVVSGELDLVHVSAMSDEEIIKELVAVKGIGRWTAEMFLLFSLARSDIFAVDDYGLRVAVKRLYDLPDLPKPGPMREIAEPWRPYRSYASLYLWRSLDNSPKVEAMEVKGS
ncbi:MAG TPA: DNA-3-methyladenine glycosylase [Chloroflexia bacterium]|nr:DNA-3-methyladenine glycosylase [Chloroflexia bacterium]